MNVVITGHANGIGRALADKFVKEGHTVTGFDVVEGNDVKETTVVSRIVESLKTADVFINNCGVDQKRMLTKVLVEWRGQDKAVVNLGSLSTYMHDTAPTDLFFSAEYFVNKQQLDQLIVKHNRTNTLPKIMNIRPGYVQTDLTDKLEGAKISPVAIANIVYNNLAMWKEVKVLDVVARR